MFFLNLRQLFLSQKGAAVILIAVLLPVIIGFAGIGVDTGMLYLAHSRLQTAVDAAAMAGSLQLPYDLEVEEGGRVDQAVREYLDVNYPEAKLVSITPGTEERSVVIKGKVSYIPFFMGFLGAGESLLTAEASAGYNNLEVVFVIDNSRSMQANAIAPTRKAIASFVELLMPEGMDTSVKLGLVPFHGMVRLPAGVDGLPAGCRNVDGTYNNGMIPMDYSREGDIEGIDIVGNGFHRLEEYLGIDYCVGVTPVQPLTDKRTEILDANDKQLAEGQSGTVIPEGIKWARHLLSPEPPFTEASAGKDMRKVMILLSDGSNMTPCAKVIAKKDGKPSKVKKCPKCGGFMYGKAWANAYFGALDIDSLCTRANADMIAEAQRAKDAGIEVFVIRFGWSLGHEKELLKQLASSKPGTEDHYYDAPKPAQLEEAFRLIGRQLGWRLL